MSKATVILVDDDRDWLRIIESKLVAAGVQVYCYLDYKDLFPAIEEFAPDALVMDVMIPEGIDGYEACRQVKQHPVFCDIPVILLTSVADHVSSTRYSHSGGSSTEADDYIPKDGDAAELVVKSVLKLTKT